MISFSSSFITITSNEMWPRLKIGVTYYSFHSTFLKTRPSFPGADRLNFSPFAKASLIFVKCCNGFPQFTSNIYFFLYQKCIGKKTLKWNTFSSESIWVCDHQILCDTLKYIFGIHSFVAKDWIKHAKRIVINIPTKVWTQCFFDFHTIHQWEKYYRFHGD